ncbi:MAG: CRISPR-associated RAMP protein [Herpetosiphonaceae bacterium]|nr:MAG: CRISPR-associated RAMP protein [Herpetosiphonaceae bacterium]
MTQPVIAFETLQNRLQFSGQLIAKTGLRIGIGRNQDIAGHDLPVIRDTMGRPFIPGSSFKGVLRSTLEAIVRGLSADPGIQRRRLACMVLLPKERCITDDEIKQWREALQDRNELSQRILEQSCLICQTFGSPWLASHIAIRDLFVNEALWFGQFEVRQSVAINRDTETAQKDHLYDFETVPPETRFDLTIEADNLADWQKGLLWLGLQPFIRGEISIGGGASRGLGQVELVEGEWRGWEAGDSPVDSVIGLLTKGLERFTPNETAWQEALRAKLKEAAGV